MEFGSQTSPSSSTAVHHGSAYFLCCYFAIQFIRRVVNVTLGNAQIIGNLTIPERGLLIIDNDVNVTGRFDIGNESFLIIDSNSTVVVEGKATPFMFCSVSVFHFVHLGNLTVGGDSQIHLNASDPSSSQSIIKIADCLSPSGGKLNVSVSKTGTYNVRSHSE